MMKILYVFLPLALMGCREPRQQGYADYYFLKHPSVVSVFPVAQKNGYEILTSTNVWFSMSHTTHPVFVLFNKAGKRVEGVLLQINPTTYCFKPKKCLEEYAQYSYTISAPEMIPVSVSFRTHGHRSEKNTLRYGWWGGAAQPTQTHIR